MNGFISWHYKGLNLVDCTLTKLDLIVPNMCFNCLICIVLYCNNFVTVGSYR